MPSPSISATVVPCGSVNTTPPALSAGVRPIIRCLTKDISPVLERFCSNHARPQPCACKEVTTSFNPSPFTSYTAIREPPGDVRPHSPKASGWYFQKEVPAFVGGCSHQP